MANREIDARTGKLYWPQDEVERRLIGVRQDFAAMLEVHADIALRNVRAGRWTPKEGECYAEGMEDALTEIVFTLENRFNEITNKARGKQNSD